MISEKNQQKAEIAKAELLKSNLSELEKEDLADALDRSLEGTNGLTQEQKIQNLSESVFSLVRLFVHARCSTGVKSWKDVLVICRRELMYLGFGLAALLLFRPEIAQVLGGLIP